MQIFSEKVNRLLVDLEKSSGQYWNIPREVGQMLYFLVRALKPKRILEIGTSNGYSGVWLSQALAHNSVDFNVSGKLFTVESHAERFLIAASNFELAGLTTWVSQIKGHAPEVFSVSDEIKKGEFDLFFFDATKKQHLDFLKEGLGFLNEGGVLVVDNVLSHWEVMQHFLEYAQSLPNLSGDLLKIGDGLYMAIKKGDV